MVILFFIAKFQSSTANLQGLRTAPSLKEEEEEGLSQEVKKLMHSLHRETVPSGYFYQYQGFWYPSNVLQGVIRCQQHFQAQDTDILLISTPKSGTTWLKALAFAVVNRTRYDYTQNPLLTNNPHDLVLFLELDLYIDKNQLPDLAGIASPRIFSTHIPYSSLPQSVIESNCRVIYICRNPSDTFVSLWKFRNKLPLEMRGRSSGIDETLDIFCRGFSIFGPYWDHVLVHWRESIQRPDKVLFLNYDDLVEDPAFHLKRLAQFLGKPFSQEEERRGMVDEILSLCSFQNLSNLDVNKTGKTQHGIENRNYFRQGKVGDSENHLTAEMKERLYQLTEQHLQGSGFVFKKI